jgi:hypothetical protein
MPAARTTKTKSRSHRGIISKTWGSYNFKTKDPVFGVLQSLIELEMKVRSVKFNTVLHDISDTSGVSYGCLIGWFYGRTISPKFANLQRVAHALGIEFGPSKYDGQGVRSHIQ